MLDLALSSPVRHAAALPAPEAALWRAVRDRDAALDGRFVYAVRSTGVYCRPGCASRRPRRDRVVFFPGPGDARAAGFRACRRCKPDAAPEDPVRARVLDACRRIEAADERIPTLAELGAAVGWSPSHLQRAFTRTLGLSPRQYAAARRGERLRAGLRAERDVARAVYDAGYGASSRAYADAPRALGMTPAAYARRGRGQRVRYAFARTPLGTLLVAATPRGLCRVALGDGRRALERELRSELPEAELARGDARLERQVTRLARWARGEIAWPKLPVDVRLTAFAARVHEALRAVPEGETLTYAELAQRAGSPRAVRAVARVMATNPVPLAVPCHRVVPKSGGAGGYRLGTERKQALLAVEAKRRSRSRSR